MEITQLQNQVSALKNVYLLSKTEPITKNMITKQLKKADIGNASSIVQKFLMTPSNGGYKWGSDVPPNVDTLKRIKEKMERTKYRKFTSEEDWKIYDLINKGIDVNEIARRLDRPVASINGRLESKAYKEFLKETNKAKEILSRGNDVRTWEQIKSEQIDHKLKDIIEQSDHQDSMVCGCDPIGKNLSGVGYVQVGDQPKADYTVTTGSTHWTISIPKKIITRLLYGTLIYSLGYATNYIINLLK